MNLHQFISLHQLISHIENNLLSRAKKRYRETKKLGGVNSYAAGYELGYIEALDDVLQTLGVPYPEIDEQIEENENESKNAR